MSGSVASDLITFWDTSHTLVAFTSLVLTSLLENS